MQREELGTEMRGEDHQLPWSGGGDKSAINKYHDCITGAAVSGCSLQQMPPCAWGRHAPCAAAVRRLRGGDASRGMPPLDPAAVAALSQRLVLGVGGRGLQFQ